MSTFLRVSTKSMSTDSESIEAFNNEIPKLLDELNDAMRKLSTCWEGPAWSAFQSNVTYHMEMLAEIYEYINEYLDSLQEAGKNYARVEQDICASIQKVNTLW